MTSSSDYNVFAHLTAEKSVMYRAVLNVFTQAKARFVIHLRPTDVERQLSDEGATYADATAIEMMLQQLIAWGNLEAHPEALKSGGKDAARRWLERQLVSIGNRFRKVCEDFQHVLAVTDMALGSSIC